MRVKDFDFEYRQIVIRDPKGGQDRFTILPETLIEPIKEHLARVKRLHEDDLHARPPARWLGSSQSTGRLILV